MTRISAVGKTQIMQSNPEGKPSSSMWDTGVPPAIFLLKTGTHLDNALGRGKLQPGGTCLSGPPLKVGSSISNRRARQACPSETSLGGTRLSGPWFDVRSSIPSRRGL